VTDEDDDRTIISRATEPDTGDTRIVRQPVVDDEATTISRGTPVDDVDERTVVSASRPVHDEPDERTVLRSDRQTPADLDDRTVIRGGSTDLDDRTVVSGGRPDSLDDATQVSRGPRPDTSDTQIHGTGAPRASAPAPGRLSGGRVAFVPGAKVESYQVRDTAPAIDNVVRTVIPAPVSPARQSRNTVAIEVATKRSTTGRGIGVIIGVIAVTVLTLAIVAGVVVVLFLL